jgi:lipid-A-disaccharide synthase
LPIASSLTEADLRPYINALDKDNTLDIKIIKDKTYDVANVCNAIIATSGTVTLEITLLGIPLVIIYKLSYLTYWIIRMLIKVQFIGLGNIVAGKKIVQELIQHHANPKEISEEIIKILEDKTYRENMIAELHSVRDMLSVSPNTKTIDQVVAAML